MAIGLGLELGSWVRDRLMVRAWVRVRFRVVFCSIIAQFYTCTVIGAVWHTAPSEKSFVQFGELHL